MTKFNIFDSQNPQSENSDLSLTEIIYLLRRHLPLIVVIASTIFFITILYTLIQIPTYTSTTMVVIDDKSTTGSMFDIGMETNISLINSMNNEIELLKSRTLSEEVVNDLWNSQQRNNLFLFGTKIYKPEGIRKTLRGLWDSIFNRGNYAKSYAENIEISDSLLFRFSGLIRSSLSVTNERNTNVLNISMTSNDPDESSLLANTVARLSQQRDMEWNAGEIVNLREFLQEQLKNVESDLVTVEESLRQFQEQEQIFELEGNAQQLLNQLGSVETKYKTILAEINIIQERMRFINRTLSQEEKTLKSQLLSSIDTRLMALRTEIAQTEANLVRNTSTYGENHEAVLS
ncbi:MAG: Wzz/FepE/Etk N-terminal domain-containing protein, partial [Candidatus Marinimicrobia bacterium]|nr:Wzz/FepE/Etk N-terminal domain-containing protein [Candidatus Neomarinimicrobiota bacterium]